MSKLATQRRPTKSAQSVSVGRASDGVIILKQVTKPRHFTLGRAKQVMDRLVPSIRSEPE